MVLRDLPQGRVGRGNPFDHLGHRHIGHPGTAVGLGHRDTPQAAAGKFVKFGHRQAPVAVARAGFDGKAFGQARDDFNGLRVRADDMGRVLRVG